jgi:hypothetical protein
LSTLIEKDTTLTKPYFYFMFQFKKYLAF